MLACPSIVLGVVVGASVLLANASAGAAIVLLGPTPYLDASNSPFDTAAPDFVLEDFEDGVLSPAGVSASAGAPIAPGVDTDSVDGDDGLVDGFGRDGHSFFFSTDGPAGITFSFDPLVLGGLPRQAGVVWTDGDGEVVFEAFDAAGVSLGVIGPTTLGDGRSDGATPEDRFFGVTHDGGISAIRIATSAGTIEVDHLQLGAFNLPPVCTEAFASPATFWPPNHTFAAVHVLGVTDPDGDPVAITVTGVGQDEPVDAVGSGATCPDALGIGDSVAQIRVERAGPGDGRVYAIDFRAEDGRGGACDGVVTVCVPHDQGHGDICGDQGPLADSTGLGCMQDCENNECLPHECDGTHVPRGVIHRMGKAGRLLDVAVRRGRPGPARRAIRLFTKVEGKVAKLDAHDVLPEACAEAVADRLAAARRRAEGWLEARGD